MSNFDTSSQVKARKLHRCCECHGAINPGDTYEKAFIIQMAMPATSRHARNAQKRVTGCLTKLIGLTISTAKGIRISSRCCVTTSVSKAVKATANTHFERIGLSS